MFMYYLLNATGIILVGLMILIVGIIVYNNFVYPMYIKWKCPKVEEEDVVIEETMEDFFQVKLFGFKTIAEECGLWKANAILMERETKVLYYYSTEFKEGRVLTPLLDTDGKPKIYCEGIKEEDTIG